MIHSEDIWASIQNDLSTEPTLNVYSGDLLTCIKKNTINNRAHEITCSKFTYKGIQFPGLVKLAEQMFIVPLCSKYKEQFSEEENKCIKMKPDIKIPVRSSSCQHADVFDFVDYFAKEKVGDLKCPICDKAIEKTSLYVDTRIYRIIKSHPDAILAIIPTDAAKGYDPDLAFPISCEDIQRMNNQMRLATGIFTQKEAKQEDKKIKIMKANVPSYMLNQMIYKPKKKRAVIKIMDIYFQSLDKAITNVK